MPSPRLVPPALLLLLAAVHLLGIAAFHSVDSRLPDGDVMGHLGAIESHVYVMQHQGLWTAVRDAFTSSGEYPPLHPLLSALALFALQPEGVFPAGVWWVDAAVFTLTLLAVYGFGRRIEGQWAGLLAAALWSLSPLALAVGRTPMPEPWLALFLICAAWALEASRGLTRFRPTALAGLLLMAGLLCKQTFAIYAAPVVLATALQGLARPETRERAAVGGLMLMAIAAPAPLLWLLSNLESQAEYLGASAGNRSGVPLLHHLLYYPMVLVGQALSVPVALLAAGAALLGGLTWAAPARRAPPSPLWGWAGALGLLVVIPKKYPRLLLPLLPLLAVHVAVACARAWRKRRLHMARPALGGLIVGALAFGAAQAVAQGPGAAALPEDLGLWYPPLTQTLDPGCLQRWIRPAHAGDPGLDAIYDAVHDALLPEERGVEPPEGQGRLVLLSQPELGCDYQTTFALAAHLQVYFRRRGMEIGDIPVATDDAERAEALLLGDWAVVVAGVEPWRCPSPPGQLDVCSLRAGFVELEPAPSTDPELQFTWHLYKRRRP